MQGFLHQQQEGGEALLPQAIVRYKECQSLHEYCQSWHCWLPVENSRPTSLSSWVHTGLFEVWMLGGHLWRSELVERRRSLVLCTIWRACFSKLLLRASASSSRASRNLHTPPRS